MPGTVRRIAALVAACIFLCAAAVFPQSRQGVVTGQLRNADGKPAVGFRVSAIEVSESGAQGATTIASLAQTDERGRYRLENIPPGRYYIMAGRLELPSYYPGGTSRASATILTVQPGSTFSNIDFVATVAVPVLLKGETRGEGLGPLPRFTVSFENPDIATRSVNITNGDGSFSIRQLLSGEYRVHVTGFPESFHVVSMTYGTVDVLNGPMKVTPSDTSPLTIRFGLAPPSRWLKIGGRVSGYENLGPVEAAVRNLRVQNTMFLQPLSAALKPDGTFEIPQVLPGEYVLHTGPFRTSVVVRDTDVTGVEIRIPPSREVTGRILVDGSFPLPRPQGFAFLGTGDIQRSYQVNDVAPDGTFKVTLLEGDYRINLAFPGDNYLVSSMRMGATVVGDTLQVKVGAENNELTVTVTGLLSEALTRVRGVVTGGNGLLAASRQVVISGTGLLGELTAPVQTNGTFEFPQVPVGMYTVRLREPTSMVPISVTVRPGMAEINDLKIKADPQAAIVGRVSVPAGDQLGVFTMTLESTQKGTLLLVSPPPAILEAMGSLTIVPIQSDGTFAAAVPEGVYRMSAVNAPPQYTVKSAVIGSTNLLKASFRVEKGKTPHEIRVSLEPR